LLNGCLIVGSSIALPACAGSGLGLEGRETSSHHVTIEQVPESARRTLLKQAGQNPIRELEQKVVNGRTVYEIELRVEGKEVEVVVAPDGKLVRVKRGDDPSHELVASMSGGRDRRHTFDVDRKALGVVGHNPYFPLTAGLKLHLTDGVQTVVFSVLDETKVVDGVETRVVEEYETRNGELIEISRNFYAVDKVKGDVYYFGEDVDIYEKGKVISHDGAWRSGVDGAKFALMMPGKPEVGDQFYLEMAPGAVERVEVETVDATFQTPARSFTSVLHAREFDELDGGTSNKWYAPGIGMIGDDAMRLVKVEQPIQ
jgi:hypothetical protein